LYFSAIQPRTNTFRDPNSLLFCDGSNDCDYNVFEETTRVEVGFGEGTESDAIAAQPREVLQGRESPLPCKPVERPEERYIKTPLTGVGHQPLKLRAVGFITRIVVLIFADDRPALRPTKLTQLASLVSSLLSLVVR